MTNRTVDFFDAQFRNQVAAQQFALNPFEEAVLPHLSGRVLDLGCGLGNLSIAAARCGCDVLAVDASPAAVEHLARVARDERLSLTPVQADIERFELPGGFDAVVSIGLLMFFPRPGALALLASIRRAVRPGGCAAVNVLVEGTTYMKMFDGDRYCLFEPAELDTAFGDWGSVLSRRDDFPAPGGTVKRFSTVIARRPATS
jgi:tellurite methyltransferase